MTPTKFKTKTGQLVKIRQLQSDDTLRLIQVFDGMGSESRYNRFLQTVDNISQTRIQQEAENIVALQGNGGFGLIALTMAEPETAVAAARYVNISDTEAEMALSVADAWHNQGIGSQLLLMLTEMAQQNGVHTLVGDAHNSNEAIWRLLEKLPYPLTTIAEGGSSRLRLDLT